MRRIVRIGELTVRLRNMPGADGRQVAAALPAALSDAAARIAGGPAPVIARRVEAPASATPPQLARAVAQALANRTSEVD